MKAARMSTKITHPLADRFFTFLKDETGWMEKLDAGPKMFLEAPVATGILFCFMGALLLGVVVSFIAVVVGLIGVLILGIWNIEQVLVTALYVIALPGWVCTWILAGLGIVFCYSYDCILITGDWLVAFFTNGPMWAAIWDWTVFLLGWGISLGLCSFLLFLAGWAISRSQLAQPILAFIGNKLNGFSEAREAREQRIAERSCEIQVWTCSHCGYLNKKNPYRCDECYHIKPVKTPVYAQYIGVIFSPFCWVGRNLRDGCIKVWNTELNILGPFGVLWEYLAAIKKGVCPTVDFVDMDVVAEQQKKSAAHRMKKEAST